MGFFPDFTLSAGDSIPRRGFATLATRYLGRSFSRHAQVRLLFYYHPEEIGYAQLYPFLYHARDFARRHGAEIRCLQVARFLEGAAPATGPADIVLVQPWFTFAPSEIRRAFEIAAGRHPGARWVFVDSYAHSDLRLAQVVEPHVDHYLKKSLFRDRRLYMQSFRGGTNLTQYYGDLAGIEAAPVDWGVPPGILPKLRLSPNFFTAARFMRSFAREPMPTRAGRGLDIQARLGRRGTPWYQAMREGALRHVEAVPGVAVSPPGRIHPDTFIRELRDARLCFSPFGYGEICWRDIEAFQAGAVLVKPDMSHLETLPDLYEAGATYLPVKWDFSDLEDVVQGALADPARMERIAREAHRRIAAYVRAARFVDDMAFIFAP